MASLAASMHPRRGRPRRATAMTVLPPAMRDLFSDAENKVLAAVVKLLPGRWRGTVPRRQLMIETGLARSTVENAMRHARKVGLIREWDDAERGYLTEIISPEWKAWIERHRGACAARPLSARGWSTTCP